MKKKLIISISASFAFALLIICIIIGTQFTNSNKVHNGNHKNKDTEVFESCESLVDACADSFFSGKLENLLSYVHPQTLKTLSVENKTTEDNIKNVLLSWYQKSYDDYLQWYDDKFFAFPTEFWVIGEYASEISFFAKAYHGFEDSYARIANYDYYGLLRDGASEARMVSALIGFVYKDEYGEYEDESCVLDLHCAKFKDSWYLLDIYLR